MLTWLKQLSFSCFWMLLSLPIFAQWDGLPDSVKRVLQPMPDSARFNWLFREAESKSASHPQVALPLLKAAYTIIQDQQPNTNQARVLNELATCYTQLDFFTDALPTLLEAEQICLQLNADSLLKNTYTLIGIVYERTQRQRDAINYYERVNQLLSKLNANPIDRAKNLTNIGHALEDLQLIDSAIQRYREALTICEENQIAFGIGLLNQNLASIHLRKQDWDAVLFHSRRAIEMAKSNQLPRIEASCYQNFASVAKAKKNYTEAIRWLHQSFAIAESIQYNSLILSNRNLMHECFVALNRPDSAFHYYKSFTQLRDSLNNSDHKKRLAVLQTIYETNQKEVSIRKLQQENEVAQLQSARKNIIIVSLCSVFLLLSIGTFFFIRQREARKKNVQLQQELIATEERRKLEQQKNENELNALKAQMNPHFIFNALNSIQAMFLLGEKQIATENLGKFSDLTRAILDSSGKKRISLQDELNILQDYLSLEKLRFDTDFTYRIDVDQPINPYGLQLPPMLVQPYVENAVKHGLMHKEGNKVLSVHFSLLDENTLQVVVTDNGVGRQKAAYYNNMRSKRHQSFATGATERRLQLLNTGRSRNIGVTYLDLIDGGTPVGTQVTITIPMDEQL